MHGMSGLFKHDWHLDFAYCGSAAVSDKGVLRSLVEAHLGRVQDRRLLVWSLLNVNTWLEVLDNV